MKVLFYNWCPIDETEGGGIAVYQRNILSHLQKSQQINIEPYFLCSGYYYDKTDHIYITEDDMTYGARIFRLINSPVYAPMRAPNDNFETMMSEDGPLKEVFRTFIDEYGPFDAIHFQTLEGLSLQVLTLKYMYPNTRFIYSVHNYTAICPNVMLWTDDDMNCEALPKKCQNNCSTCMNRYDRPSTSFLKKSRYLLNKDHKQLYYYTRGVKFVTRKYLPVKKRNNNKVYLEYIRKSTQAINTYIDVVLAVSERVRDIVVRRGIDAQKVRVSYIGTKFAENPVGHNITDIDEKIFGVVYMGYMRKEKGFYFFLEALEEINSEIAKGMAITFASKITDKGAERRINSLKKKFHSIRLFDGYSHDQIPEILEGAHLGVVPVLWEDNLPQITIEMISSGVPVLASSYGGASELCSNVMFRFEGNNIADFNQKLEKICNDRSYLHEYWKAVKPLTTMSMHICELADCYGYKK